MEVFAPDSEIGKPAVTHYKVLERYGYTTLVECILETGRTHQIRAHLASISHPIIGDMKYAGENAYKLHKDKYNITSQMLHSYITEYDGIEIKAPVPDNMSRIIEEEYGNLEF